MTQYGFYFNGQRCTGCKTCELVCKDYHDLGPDILFRRIYDFEGGSWEKTSEGAWEKTAFNYHLAISCNHCDNPACVENCPTGAMQKDAETGLVNSNPEVCIGCGTCQKSCPYDAPRIDAELVDLPQMRWMPRPRAQRRTAHVRGSLSASCLGIRPHRRAAGEARRSLPGSAATRADHESQPRYRKLPGHRLRYVQPR